MTAVSSVQSAEDVVNLALTRIGYKKRVGNLYEGSEQAKAALDVYAQTRDAVIRESNWAFAERIVAATLTGNAAPAPWSVEYEYPADTIRLRNIFAAGYVSTNPTPNLWTIGNASYGTVIWCNLPGATLVYSGQVTNPSQWDPLFTEAVAAALGRRLAPRLMDKEALQAAAQDEETTIKVAMEADEA